MIKINEKIKGLYAQKPLRLGLYVIATLFVLSVTLQLGIFIGYHKASFARDWGDHYKKNFGMERPESFRGMMGNTLPIAHGATGKVLSVSLPNFIVEDTNGTEKTIIITNETIIRSGTQNASSSIITPNSIVMVLGNPNTSGQIEAKLIRLMPLGFSTSTSVENQNYGNQPGRGGMMFRR